jgi:hypothetical protein
MDCACTLSTMQKCHAPCWECTFSQNFVPRIFWVSLVVPIFHLISLVGAIHIGVCAIRCVGIWIAFPDMRIFWSPLELVCAQLWCHCLNCMPAIYIICIDDFGLQQFKPAGIFEYETDSQMVKMFAWTYGKPFWAAY